MASNVEANATCKLCSGLYTDPRMLLCLHSFCMKCLQKYFDGQSTKTKVKCPTCKKESPLPEGGIGAIQKDLRGSYEAEVAHYQQKIKSKANASCERCVEECPATSFCCNCYELLCKDCTKDHERSRKTHGHELVEVGESESGESLSSVLKSISHKPVFCPLHGDETLKYYCFTCGTIICRDCADDEHVDHKRSRVEKVAENEKKELLVKLQEANTVKSKLAAAMKQCENTMQRVETKKKSVDEEIKRTFNVIQEALRSREAVLLAKSSKIATGKKTALSIQHEVLKKIHTELSAASKKINDATGVYTPAEMLAAKGAMTFTLQDLLKQFEKCHLQPCKNDVMPTSLNHTDLVKEISTFGVVTGGCYPAQSTAGVYVPTAVVGKARKIVVTARDLQGKPYPHGGERVHAVLQLLGSNDPPVNCVMVDKDNGMYEVTFTPQVCGEHELAITINNDSIKRSPFTIYARQEKNYTTSQGCQRTFGCSGYPWDVAVDDNGHVYVAVYGYHCISVFNKKDGNTICTIGKAGQSGTENGWFHYPSAIAIRGDVLYIAENSNHRVQKMSTSGDFISKFGSNGNGNGELSCPRGICLDPEGKIFVSEYSNNRVSVFTPDGTFLYHITEKLSSPWGLAFDPSGNLHVANYSTHTISVFNPDGTYITEYGNGVIQYPAGIAINDEGYSFIGEYYAYQRYSGGPYNTGRLFVLDSSHKLIYTAQNFYYAVGVALDKEGSVYVADQQYNYAAQYW